MEWLTEAIFVWFVIFFDYGNQHNAPFNKQSIKWNLVCFWSNIYSEYYIPNDISNKRAMQNNKQSTDQRCCWHPNPIW